MDWAAWFTAGTAPPLLLLTSLTGSVFWLGFVATCCEFLKYIPAVDP